MYLTTTRTACTPVTSFGLIGAAKNRKWHADAKRFGGFEVDELLDLRGLLYR
jgi:hypothetical protein